MSTVITRDPTAKPKVSVDEYLRRDEASDCKLEFVDGEVREMTGASREHGLLGWRIGGLLFKSFDRGGRFEAYIGDMRVRAGETGPYYYPDVAVAPVPPIIERDRGQTLLNPAVVFEVISPSTESIDRGEKLRGYAKIRTLSDYLLVAQDEVRVDHCSRQSDGSWRLVILTDPSEVLTLSSLGIELSLGDIYFGVLSGSPGG